MDALEELAKRSTEIEEKIGYFFREPSYLVLAFTHRSFVNENRDAKEHNERLEFLGDSILGLLIAEYLYRYLPTTPEGELSYLRSRLVEASSCVTYVQKLEVEPYLLLGKGERRNGGRGRESILADLFEAIIGAIYLDGGIEAARRFLFKNFSHEIDSILKTPLRNWKAQLQDYCQKKYHQTPLYKVVSESGPDHSKTFRISVIIGKEEMGYGEGASKKEAQQGAAQKALEKIQIERSLGELAYQLTDKKPIRMGYDQFFPVVDRPSKHTGFLQRPASLVDISSIQGIVCGLLVALDNSQETFEEDETNFFPRQSGNVVILHPEASIDWPDLFEKNKAAYYLSVYASRKSLYFWNRKDPLTSSLKQAGYFPGDRLTDGKNPIILR